MTSEFVWFFLLCLCGNLILMFKIEKKLKDSLGRAGILSTPHGDILTPAFAAVGTKATVKSLSSEQVKEAGS